jgi:nucleoside-diphosphate-sugar epimerase
MKILVTGGTGKVGTEVVQALLRRGESVRVLTPEQGSQAARRGRGGCRRPAGSRLGPLGTERRRHPIHCLEARLFLPE